MNQSFQSTVANMLGELFENPETRRDLFRSNDFINAVKVSEDYFGNIEKKNTTCKLWITYCKMVLILKDFVYAEKSGNWELHGQTIEKMIPFFHATGHMNYAKSA